MTVQSVTSVGAVNGYLHQLISRTRVLAPGEVEDLLDALGPDGFAWLRGGVGFVTAGVAARIPVGTGPGRFDWRCRVF